VKRAGRGCVAALLLLLVAGCVGAAPTTPAFAAKAGQTAKAALAGRLTEPYLGTVLSDMENDFTSVQGTFDSIQPPDDPAADTLREQLDSLLTDGADGLAQLRILARRGDRERLAGTAAELAKVATGLRQFSEEHPA
jgi:ABC-type sugar transport system substrate-binding protein